MSGWAPPDLASPLRLILVRHGETTFTAQRRYSGRGDVPLSERGREQARAVAERLARLTGARPATGAAAPVAATTAATSSSSASASSSVDAAGPVPLVRGQVAIVLTSPLARCRQTAGVIAEAVGASVVVRDDLVECDFGEWEGRPFGEVGERYPEELAAWLASAAVAPPGGESFHDVGARTAGFVEWLRATYPGKLVIAVTHVSPIKLILRDALAATDDFLYRCFLSPAGLSTLDWYADGGVAVRSINDIAHLE